MTAVLEGTWENAAFKLVIQGTNYVSLRNDEFYGTGQLSYDGKYFILASTHAWRDGGWIPFEETIRGECTVRGNTLVISKVEGRYGAFNGAWERTEDIHIDIYNSVARQREV
jgi:hypothetical protein